MRFLLDLAWRDLRADGRPLWVFTSCLHLCRRGDRRPRLLHGPADWVLIGRDQRGRDALPTKPQADRPILPWTAIAEEPPRSFGGPVVWQRVVQSTARRKPRCDQPRISPTAGRDSAFLGVAGLEHLAGIGDRRL